MSEIKPLLIGFRSNEKNYLQIFSKYSHKISMSSELSFHDIIIPVDSRFQTISNLHGVTLNQ